MAENKDVKGARKAGAQAAGVAKGAKADFLGSDIFQKNLALALGLLDDPLTTGPEEVRMLSESFAADLGQKSRGDFAEMMNKLAQGSGTRSGPTIEGSALLAANTGQALAQGLRDIKLQAAQSRVEDIARAMSIAQGLQNQQYSFDTQLMNAYLDQGQLLAQVAGVPSPAAQIGSGVGSLAGSFLGGEGFAKLLPG